MALICFENSVWEISVAFSWPSFWANVTATRPERVFCKRLLHRTKGRSTATTHPESAFWVGPHRLSENSRRLWLSEIPCWKSFRANFDAAGKFLTDFPAARNAIPANAWALSGKENGCWKIGCAFGNAAGFSPPRPPQPS